MFIEILSYIANKESRLNDLREIFFLSAPIAVQNGDSERKNSFWKTWAEPYISNWPDEVFFGCDLNSKRTLGYLMGCHNSTTALDIISERQKSYTLFADLFKKYPAHFHINCHPDARGQGVGSFLVQEYLIELRKWGVRGAHIVTFPSEKNVEFYRKNKFSFTAEREYNNQKLLFMGINF